MKRVSQNVYLIDFYRERCILGCLYKPKSFLLADGRDQGCLIEARSYRGVVDSCLLAVKTLISLNLDEAANSAVAFSIYQINQLYTCTIEKESNVDI